MTTPTYSEFVSVYAEKFNNSVKRFSNYVNSQRRHVFPFIGNLPMDEITPVLIKKVPEKMRTRRMNETTVKVVCEFMSHTFDLAVEKDLIKGNPCALLFRWNTSVPCNYPISLDDHNQILSCIDRLPLKNLYGFCYTTGISYLQAKTLHNCDVDIENGTFYMNTNRYKGIIYIPERTLPYMSAQMAFNKTAGETEDDLFFVTDKARHIARVDVHISTRIMRTLLNKTDFSLGELCRGYSRMLSIIGEGEYYDHNYQHGA